VDKLVDNRIEPVKMPQGASWREPEIPNKRHNPGAALGRLKGQCLFGFDSLTLQVGLQSGKWIKVAQREN
jgi:hypothetical protein